ncbi:MAG: hypothetical protein ACYDAG_13070, partial [Chloroflexota bacterium]
MAQLVAQALAGQPPTVLQRRFQRHVGQALSGLAASAGRLAAAANALWPTNALSVFQQVAVSSSHPELVTGLALVGCEPARHTLVIHRLARPRQNAGLLLPRDAPTTLPAGQHHIGIRIGDNEGVAVAAVATGDTNDAAFTRIALAINGARAGVAAGTSHPTASTAQLTLVAIGLGTPGAFAVADVPGQGSVVAGTGGGG